MTAHMAAEKRPPSSDQEQKAQDPKKKKVNLAGFFVFVCRVFVCVPVERVELAD